MEITNPVTGEIVNKPDPRPFDQTLREIGEGSTNSEMGESLHRLIERVQDTGKAGTLTLTVGVGFDGQGRIVIKDQISLKLPEHSRPTTSFFVDKEGNPSRRDPNQPELPGVIHAEFNTTREAN